jgi:hypothetical protein
MREKHWQWRVGNTACGTSNVRADFRGKQCENQRQPVVAVAWSTTTSSTTTAATATATATTTTTGTTDTTDRQAMRKLDARCRVVVAVVAVVVVAVVAVVAVVVVVAAVVVVVVVVAAAAARYKDIPSAPLPQGVQEGRFRFEFCWNLKPPPTPRLMPVGRRASESQPAPAWWQTYR